MFLNMDVNREEERLCGMALGNPAKWVLSDKKDDLKIVLLHTIVDIPKLYLECSKW